MSPVALITGGQTGIGLGIARALDAAGWTVALASLSEPDAPDVAAALARLGPGARYFQHDVSAVANHGALIDRVEAAAGPIVTFVSNAGVGARVRDDLLNLSPDDFDRVHEVNLRGAFFLAQEVVRRMLAQPADHYRSLVFITSVSAEMVSADRAEYCISKAGAAMMAKLFAVRLAEEGIGVFELRPGVIATQMTEGVRDRYTARIADGLVPAARWGEPEDIARVVVPLAEGQFAFSSGATIPVDGCLSIPRL